MKTNKKINNKVVLNIKNMVTDNKFEFLLDCFFIFLIFISSINYEYKRTVFYVVVLWAKEVYINFRYRQNYIMVLFYCTIMFFIISRPLIGFFLKYHWEIFYSTNASFFVLMATSLSMVFINYGALFYDSIRGKNEKITEVNDKIENKNIKSIKRYNYKKYLLISSLIVWIVCFICIFISNMDKLMFVRKNTYIEYYSSYKNMFPSIVNVFASLFSYVILILLSLKPNKKTTFVVLASNILITVPLLLMGLRNNFLMSIVFTFVYLLYRYKKVRRMLHSRKVIISACVTVMVLGVGMNFIGNSRENKKNKSSNMLNTVMIFGYTQGTTFDTIRQAYQYKDLLPEHTSYTLGPVTDYIQYGSVGQKLFNSIDLGNGNNILRGTQGNNLAHHLSYAVLKDKYLEGRGRGSSYLPELYLDFGYLGVCIGSLLLGLIMQMAHCNVFKGVGSTVFYLGVLYNIWFIPRAAYADIFQYLFTYQFWFVVFLIVILAIFVKGIYFMGSKIFRRQKNAN